MILHNRGSAFSTDPAHPGHVGPGLRPPHTLLPVIAEADGLVLGVGCQGGSAQPWILAQLARELLDTGADLDAVLGRPPLRRRSPRLGHEVLTPRRGAGHRRRDGGGRRARPARRARPRPDRRSRSRAGGPRAHRRPPRRRQRSARGRPCDRPARPPADMTTTGRKTMRATAHVLDPLSSAEIASFVAAVRESDRIGERPRFWGIALDEEKARGSRPGGPRPVRLVVMNPDARAAWEVRGWTSGDGSPAVVEVWMDVDHRRPGVSSDEARLIAQAARNSPLLHEALAERGITDTSLIWVDPESITGFVPEDLGDRRLSWGTVWHREFPEDNGYARPVAGLVPILDLDTLEVVRIEDHGIIPMASETGAYTSGTWGPDREVSALDIVQPDGPGFRIEGHQVTWQNWSFRVGFTHREGLVLHDLTYRDGDVERPVLHRAAVNEMYVPYLDDDPTAYRKNFFDWGEYGAGPLTASLELGCDCLGEIRYFDVQYLDGHGVPQTVVNGICLHEEDDSILWKHVNTRTGSARCGGAADS
ncbi:hypothetical protein A7K94_0205965 [Modestobacter sp. VKM Ac-2676]|nr:hypothetical protein A7K94_0205965 [Modestobacter sp. VKM Ac-2676]